MIRIVIFYYSDGNVLKLLAMNIQNVKEIKFLFNIILNKSIIYAEANIVIFPFLG